ncbi:MAG: hypothetical protein IT582_00125, partial [Opitutaceae bacterium]|nr:hypothetical protein [Opitutaceae bacterium]
MPGYSYPRFPSRSRRWLFRLGSTLLLSANLAWSADPAPSPAATITLREALGATLEHNPALRVQKSVIEQKTGIF